MSRYTILIVDDDKLLQKALRNILSEQYNPVIAGSGEEALRLLNRTDIDLVLLDIRLPGMDGIATLQQIKRMPKAPLVIMMTAYEDIKSVISSIKSGAFDYLVKPLEMEMLELVIAKALETLQLKKEVEELRQGYHQKFDIKDIISESDSIKKIFGFAEKIAKTPDTTVLIEGESGVGKEVVARMIHSQSHRFNKPFIGINCGAITRELIESELFGYEKGTFTGGLQEGKKGKIELADGGTLLLDEIGELQPDAQVKLLRFLEEREFYPVGATQQKKVDVRIITATNKNLEQLVQQGSFREDLYYRLNVARIIVPPLRSRTSDIVPLSLLFMHRFNQKFGKNFDSIASDARAILIRHPWRGNIRELKNTIERIVLMEDGPCIQPSHLAFSKIAGHGPTTDTDPFLIIPAQGIKLEQVVKELIIQALGICGGNRTQAAKLLGISRPTLLYRIEKLKIHTE